MDEIPEGFLNAEEEFDFVKRRLIVTLEKKIFPGSVVETTEGRFRVYIVLFYLCAVVYMLFNIIVKGGYNIYTPILMTVGGLLVCIEWFMLLYKGYKGRKGIAMFLSMLEMETLDNEMEDEWYDCFCKNAGLCQVITDEEVYAAYDNYLDYKCRYYQHKIDLDSLEM